MSQWTCLSVWVSILWVVECDEKTGRAWEEATAIQFVIAKFNTIVNFNLGIASCYPSAHTCQICLCVCLSVCLLRRQWYPKVAPVCWKGSLKSYISRILISPLPPTSNPHNTQTLASTTPPVWSPCDSNWACGWSHSWLPLPTWCWISRLTSWG